MTTVVKHSLVELHPQERPNLILEIVYATRNNFMGEVLYPAARCFLHSTVKRALLAVADDFAALSLGLKVFDGYRPLSVQKRMWDKIQDERFVANPYKMGGRHTRGTAVDLTLIDHANNELPMPTPFDSLNAQAASDYPDLPQKVLDARSLLCQMMEKHGFIQLPTEWWHFDYQGWQDASLYPALDLSFEKIQ